MAFDEVEVRTRFDGRWVGGFEVVSVEPGEGAPGRSGTGAPGAGGARGAAYTLRRRSDGRVLPARFGAHEIRRVSR